MITFIFMVKSSLTESEKNEIIEHVKGHRNEWTI